VDVLRTIDFNTTIGKDQSAHDILLSRRVRVKHLPGEVPVVPLTFTPLLYPPGELVYPHNSGDNLMQGVAYRIMKVKEGDGWADPPLPTVSVKETFKPLLARLKHYATSIEPMSTNVYVNSCDPSRRARYAIAERQLEYLRRPKPKQFVKLEPADRLRKEPVARVITDPGPFVNLKLGVFMKPVEHHAILMFKRFVGSNVIMKGMNAVEIAEDFVETCGMYGDPVYIRGDAHRFDAHTRVAIREELEYVVYHFFFPGYRKELKMQLDPLLIRKVVARTADLVFQHIMDSRGSGEHNTGIGNCIITVCILLSWIMRKELLASPKNNGDDWGVILDRKDVPKFQDGFADYCLSLGYNMAVEVPTDVIEEMEFCQTRPVRGPSGWIMVRDPRVCRLKDLFTFRVKTEKQYRRWCASVAESGLAMSSGIPILQEFYTCFHRSALGSKPGRFFDKHQGRQVLSRGLTYRRMSITSETRYSFFLAFGYTPDEQIALEQEYLKVRDLEFCDPLAYSKDVVHFAESSNPPSVSF